MVANAASADQTIELSVVIDSAIEKVWEALTIPALMKQWMFESEIEIISDWVIGHPIIIRGNMHGIDFENRGTLLQFDPLCNVKYSHLSSLSELPNLAENYTTVEFKLTRQSAQTILTLVLNNFPTTEIKSHFAFYWSVAIEVLKKFVEQLNN